MVVMTHTFDIFMDDAKECVELLVKYRKLYQHNRDKIVKLCKNYPLDNDDIYITNIRLRLCDKEINQWVHCLKHNLRVSKKLLSDDEFTKLREYIAPYLHESKSDR